jgi:hypothetical protein
MKFRKKPVVIEAIQWDGTMSRMDDIISAYPSLVTVAKSYKGNDCHHWEIATLEGKHVVSKGDFVICGVKDEFYPCKPDIFHMTYEAA